MLTRQTRRSFLKLAAAILAIPATWKLGAPAWGGPQLPRGFAFQLHLHAHSSHARSVKATLPGNAPSMRWHSAHGVASGVDNLWWSEHDHAYHQSATQVLAFDPPRELEPNDILGIRPDTRSAAYGSQSAPPLSARPILKVNSSGEGRLKIKCYLSWHPLEGGGEVREIRSWSRAAGNFEIDLKEELIERGAHLDNVLEKVQLIGRRTRVSVSNVEVRCDDASPAGLFQTARAIAAANSTEFGTQEFVSVEYTGSDKRHFNAYLPDGEHLSPSEHKLPASNLAARVHSRGGLLAINHPFSVQAQARISAGVVPGTAQQLTEVNCWDADVIEAGYLRGRGGQSGREHLDLWDIIVANRNFLQTPRVILGVGVSDSHGKVPHGGPHCTWLIAPTRPTQIEAVALLKQARIYFGDYEVVPAFSATPLDLTVDIAGAVTASFPDGFVAEDAYLVEVPTIEGPATNPAALPNYYPVLTRTQLSSTIPMTVSPSSTSLYRLELVREGNCVASTNHRGVGNDNP